MKKSSFLFAMVAFFLSGCDQEPADNIYNSYYYESDSASAECVTDFDCDDWNPCTKDTCHNYACKNEYSHELCENLDLPGLYECLTDSDCNDFNECTDNFCSKEGVCGQNYRLDIKGCCVSVFDCENQVGFFMSCEDYHCVWTPKCDSDYECDDGNPCTKDTCNNKTCENVELPGDCECLTHSDCEDDNECTENFCSNEGVCGQNYRLDIEGCCVSVFDCENQVGFFVTCEDYHCIWTPSGMCETDDDCSADNEPCTTSACIDNECAQIEVPNCCSTAADCDDGDPATTDFCYGNGDLVCAHIVNPACTTYLDCDDGNMCTFEYCGVENGQAQCAYIPQTCGDGDPCTVDMCDSQEGCIYTSLCDDANPCTLDVCDNGACSYDVIESCCQNDNDCDDGISCTLEYCEDNTCNYQVLENCVAVCSNDAECDDGNETTLDQCVDKACESCLNLNITADALSPGGETMLGYWKVVAVFDIFVIDEEPLFVEEMVFKINSSPINTANWEAIDENSSVLGHVNSPAEGDVTFTNITFNPGFNKITLRADLLSGQPGDFMQLLIGTCDDYIVASPALVIK